MTTRPLLDCLCPECETERRQEAATAAAPAPRPPHTLTPGSWRRLPVRARTLPTRCDCHLCGSNRAAAADARRRREDRAREAGGL